MQLTSFKPRAFFDTAEAEVLFSQSPVLKSILDRYKAAVNDLLIQTSTPEMVMDKWLNIYNGSFGFEGNSLNGLYSKQYFLHPEQNPALPFIYDPSMGCYIGFLWEISECEDFRPVLTYENVSKLPGLHIYVSPFDDYISSGGDMDARLTVVWFKAENPFTIMGDAGALYKYETLAKVGEWYEYGLAAGAQPIRDAGYDLILSQKGSFLSQEAFILNPAVQVMKTSWTTWRKTNVPKL